MALSFLYLAFVQVLQLVRLMRRGDEQLAIEILMLRHEVAVPITVFVRSGGHPHDGLVEALAARSEPSLLSRIGKDLGTLTRRLGNVLRFRALV
jgi:hypothetical protein